MESPPLLGKRAAAAAAAARQGRDPRAHVFRPVRSASPGIGPSGVAPPAAALRRSRSLPALPTAAPAQPQKLAASSGCGIDSLQSPADRGVDPQPDTWGPLGSSETLKKGPEDAFLSSCESAKTVCETEAGPSGQVSVSGVPKGALECPAAKVDAKESGAEPRSDDDSPGDESCPRRPDHLKGLASFQRSHSTSASLGLAFPPQDGSAAVGRWPSLADRDAEVWGNATFSLGYEPDYTRPADAHRYRRVRAPFRARTVLRRLRTSENAVAVSRLTGCRTC